MNGFIGLTLNEALIKAEKEGLKAAVTHDETKRSLMEKDRDIVVRAIEKDGAVILTVCGFKTNV